MRLKVAPTKRLSAVRRSRESEFPPTRKGGRQSAVSGQKESGIGVPLQERAVGSQLSAVRRSRESEFTRKGGQSAVSGQKKSGIGVPSYKKGRSAVSCQRLEGNRSSLLQESQKRVGSRSSLLARKSEGVGNRSSLLQERAVGSQLSAVRRSRESEFPPTRKSARQSAVRKSESGIGVPSYKKVRRSRESEFPPTRKSEGVGNRSSLLQEGGIVSRVLAFDRDRSLRHQRLNLRIQLEESGYAGQSIPGLKHGS